ncbi:hypothetical protein M0P98_02895 [bacterium]|nr:hypothetical protein [bacterium]
MKTRRSTIIVILLFTVIILQYLFFVKASERFIVKKIASLPTDTINIDTVSCKFPSIFVNKIDVSTPLFSLFLKELKVRPMFLRKAFAFSAPGDVVLKDTKRDISIKGSFSGSFKGQTINVDRTNIEIEKVGTLEIKGFLENWGKGNFNTSVEFKGVEIEEIKQIFDLNLPFSGTVFGTANFVSTGQEKLQTISFDVNIKDLATSEDAKFMAYVKGVYDISKKSAKINNGYISNAFGGKISFNGDVSYDEFNLSFNTDNMNLEEFFKLLPLEIRDKYKLNIQGGSAILNDFKVTNIKKNSNLMVLYP